MLCRLVRLRLYAKDRLGYVYCGLSYFSPFAIMLFGMLALPGCSGMNVPDPAVIYIAFGDSTTAGPSDRNYWEIVRDDLGQPIDSFANEGKGGEPSDQGLTRLRALLDREIYPNARVLLYWQGSGGMIDLITSIDPFLLFSPVSSDYPFSDRLDQMLDSIQADIEQAIQIAHKANLKVYVATYYSMRASIGNCDPMFLDILLAPQAGNANEYVVLLNKRIRLAVENQSATLVDVAGQAELISQDSDNYFDCNHLSAEGNQIAAEVFLNVIKSQ